MSNIKEIIIEFVKCSYPVKLDVLAQTVSRKANTYNYNLFKVLDELIKDKKIYVLKNDEVYFIFPESIEIVTSMFNDGESKIYTISITKDNCDLDIGFDYLPCLADLVDKISSLTFINNYFNKEELIELLMSVNEKNWPETDEEFCGGMRCDDLHTNDNILIHFLKN